MTIGLMINQEKPNAKAVALDVINWLEAKNVSVKLTERDAVVLHRADLGGTLQELATTDLIIILGGDGTLLNAAQFAAFNRIPLLGINLGTLGFLTDIEVKDLVNSLHLLLNQDYQLEQRLMLTIKVIRNNRIFRELDSLNDAVIKGRLSRLVTVKITVNGQVANDYSADGVIVATPTGSTAYSLSAGGPIVSPDLGAIIVTPICPHTLTHRPLVLSPHNEIQLELLADRSEAMLTVDGQIGIDLLPQDKIIIQKSSYTTTLVKLNGYDFFSTLRQKV